MPHSGVVGYMAIRVRKYSQFETWLRPEPSGLHCVPGGFYIDPVRPVDRAIITHGHSDHARPGHGAVLATRETIAIMRARLGPDAASHYQESPYGQPNTIGDVTVLFITEATFGLPVFRHESDAGEIGRLLASLQESPDRTQLVGAYGLGKTQRLIALLRAASYDRPIWLHGALASMCYLYKQLGVDLGELKSVKDAKSKLPGEIVLCPPSALKDRWSRRLADPVIAFASGWMRVRARARQRGVELPLVISDHCDWPELVQTIAESKAEEIWVTHGREEALVHQVTRMGKRARALALMGFEEEAE
jgi:putative mRNA 3-end processing factor